MVAALGVAAVPASASDLPEGGAEADTGEAEVVVTGTRIARPDFESANPITSYRAEDVERSGNVNLTDFLLRVPALSGSLDSTQTAGFDAIARNPFGGTGLNQLNLRNLGTNRTLVLVNGRRHVAGEPSTAAVDINSIPTDLVERVDVLTGGASAIYGADGVSGVVNFILRRDFEGLVARAQSGISEEADGATSLLSLVGGRNFADGRANVTLAYEFGSANAVANDDRDFLRGPRRRYLVANPNDPFDDPNLPDNVLLGDLRYAGESIFGAVDINGDFVPDFRGDGAVFDQGQLVSFYAIGGDSTPAAGYIGDLLPRIRRHAVNLFTHYEFGPALTLTAEAKFAEVRASTLNAFTGNYPATLFIDNAFIPASIREAALAAGVTSFTSNRSNWDYDRRGEDNRRRTWRGVLGAEGRIGPHATYDAYLTHGRTDIRIRKLNDRLADRVTAALDAVIDPATGRPTCRSNIDRAAAAALGAVTFTPGPNSGCVPLNTFGAFVADPASVAFFQIDHDSPARLRQTVANASVSGDFGRFFTLPGGPVAFAFGGEYRRESSSFEPNRFLRDSLFFQFDQPGGVQPIRGRFSVREVFGEVNAPLFKDRPFAHLLSVGAAGRLSDYSTIGNTETWQFNGIYAPIRDLSFRGSYGEAVRAPNIGELFTPSAASTNFIIDPCDLSLRDNGTEFRQANCAALLSALGVDPATYAPVSGGGSDGDGTAFGRFRGNPDLGAETARTWTAGVVVRPRFLRGLTASADWYDIRLEGAISTPGAQTITELCVDQPSLDNVYCDALTRRQGTGKVISYIVQPQNVSEFRTAGLDFNLAYGLRTSGFGSFDLRLVAGYLHRLDIIATPGAAVEDQVGQVGRPKWTATFSPTWTLGALTLAYNLRWIDRQRRFAKAVTDADPDFAPAELLRHREAWLHDLQAQFRVDERFSVYGGVNNLANQKPDEDAYDTPVPALGRFFYAGVRLGL